MKRHKGESEIDFWRRRVAADPDVIITDRGVEVLHRPGESREEYSARLHAVRPPLSDEAKIEIREAADEYWAAMASRQHQRQALPPLRTERRAACSS